MSKVALDPTVHYHLASVVSLIIIGSRGLRIDVISSKREWEYGMKAGISPNVGKPALLRPTPRLISRQGEKCIEQLGRK